ncbi:MAG: hypothetical protein NTZ27_00110 [Ignavibacteriales bacterium]|nr:hypothetical protein [Ignavibacteriales bacterium]
MSKTLHRIFILILILIGTATFFYFGIYGYSYYSTSNEERFFNELHKFLKPSGLIGHGLGIIGSLMMIIGVSTYMIRKRVRKFVRLGFLKYWLEIHIFLCSVGPILVLYHTTFKFGGIVAVSFWSMIAVVISGVIGRFIYIQIPRTIQGQEYSLDELKSLDQDYTHRLKAEFGLDDILITKLEYFNKIQIHKRTNFFSIGWLILKDYFMNKKLISEFKKELILRKIEPNKVKAIVKLCNSKLILSRKISLLHSVHKIFKYWHIVHLPFAIIMLIIMLVHVTVAVAFGYKWVF